MNQVDRVAVKSLTSRYKIGRTALYERFKQINIEPQKDGNRSYVCSMQLSRLDKLDNHLNAGGSFESFRATENIADFPKTPEIISPTLERINQEEAPPQLDLPSVVYKLIEVIGTQRQMRSHLEQYRELEEIALRGWILRTSTIYEITHFKPRGTEATHGCFRFLKAGKIGRESAWKVSI